MLHIRKVIQKFSAKESKEFIFWLKQNYAGKLVRLFVLLRENKLEESAIANELETSPAAYYALKSRLNVRLQEFFSYSIPDSNIELLKNVSNIPNLLFNYPKEIAITQLLKMEKDLIDYDIPHALTTVYSALKKLTRYSQKYFDYTQLYNKHLAYTMAIDKAKELLADFNQTLGEYLMSRQEELFEMLGFIRQEMRNYAQLYKSHHLTVYQYILETEYILFAATNEKDELPLSMEEMLQQTDKILKLYKADSSYCFMDNLIHFLWFEYFYQKRAKLKTAEYFDLVDGKLSQLLLNNFCCFPSLFLLSKVEWYLDHNKEKKLYEESKLLAYTYNPEVEDIPNYVNYIKYLAIAAYYSKRYNECVILLNELLNKISFRNFTYAETEVKLFLVTCYLMTNKPELAMVLMKNVRRKIRHKDPDIYENARIFSNIFSLAIDVFVTDKQEKFLKLKNSFQSVKQKNGKMLAYLRVDDSFLQAISVASRGPK
jgi:hypothetical protein